MRNLNIPKKRLFIMLSKDKYFLPLKRFICDENRKKSCQGLSADDNN